jgi:penicillin-binding protein 1B
LLSAESEQARPARDHVLRAMVEQRTLAGRAAREAMERPLPRRSGTSSPGRYGYFVDVAREEIGRRTALPKSGEVRIDTTLDPRLQAVAEAAVRDGLDRLERRRKLATGSLQAALVAIEPASGHVRALVGGRRYVDSQFNRATRARRQPGSIFKPFVYAAALATGLDGGPDSITPATTIVDEPTTFWHAGKPYEPGNFHDAFNGPVTVRQALMKSLNIPTVKMAEQIGYAQAAAVAKRAGLPAIGATPAMALGSYVATPIDMAGAYTVFANRGVYLQPSWIKMVRDDEGRAIYTSKLVKKEALDYRVAYMMTNLMEDVVRAGTGAGVRSRGFTLPVAGKTGTSHDGWFAGYTSKLICVVWVGYDDNRDIVLEGARSALPIWAEFMKRAHQYRSYKHAAPFAAPEGIVNVDVDSTSGKLFSSSCTGTHRPEVFLAGTQPLETCGGGGLTQVASWDPDPPATVDEGAAQSDGRKVSSRRVDSIPVKPLEGPDGRPKPAEPKRGFFGRILEVFK